MGNSNSASVDINVDWGQEIEVAQAGQPLLGQVVVKVKRFMEGGNVKLLFTGKEWTVIPSKSEDKNNRMITAEHILLRQSLPLHVWPDKEKIEKGTYSFPFTLPLPDDLPSSTSYPTRKGKYGFRIQYTLSATVEGRSKAPPLNKEVHFDVRSAPLPSEKVPCVVDPKTYQLNSMGLFDAGLVAIGASIPNSHVGRGEDLEIHLACRNNSRINIRNVSVTLCETMQWSPCPGGESRSATRKLRKIKDVDRDSIIKHRMDRKSVRRSKKDFSILETTCAEICEDLASGWGKIKVQIPTGSRDSYQGELVHISHSLKVKIETSSLTSNPITRIPLRIGTSSRYNGPRPTIVNGSGGQPVPACPSCDTSINTEARQMLSIQPVMTDPLFLPNEQPYEQELQQHQELQHQHQGLYPQHLQVSLPIVTAVAVPNDIAAAISRVQDNGIIHLGRDAVIDDDSELTNESDRELTNLVPIPPPVPVDRIKVSIASLLRQMSSSTNDFDLVNDSLLTDTRWVRLFATMSPDDYGLIVGHVKVPADQPRMAALLAEYVNGGRLTCIYVAAAVRKTTQCYRLNTVDRLLPLCVDASTNYAILRQELNELEQTVAMLRSRGSAVSTTLLKVPANFNKTPPTAR